MDKVVLEARVAWQDGEYLAVIDGLGIEAMGETVEEAQENLIKSFRSWLEVREGAEDLEQSLAEAGYPGVEEDTELELQFVE